jgi:protein-S-isoprenylcysteine O-methyltransferase Ste14
MSVIGRVFGGFRGAVLESFLLWILPGVFVPEKILTPEIITLFSLWLVWTWLERKQKVFKGVRKSPYDKYSFELIMWGIYVTQIVGVIDYYYLQSYSLNSISSHVLFAIGVILWILGGIVRRIAIATLGRYFTGVIQIIPGHTVIKTGIYKYIRHPGYAGELLSFLASSLVLQSIILAVVWTFILLPIYYYRIRNEETMLLAVIGEEYKTYMKEVKRFAPFVF